MTHEAELVERIRGGDAGAFEALLRPHRTGMLNMAYRIMGDSEDAHEVCQDALVKIFRFIDRYRTNRSFRNWAFKIVVNTAYDHLRRRKRRFDLVESGKQAGVPSGDNPEARLLGRETRRRIFNALRDLSPRERTVFLLRDEEGYSISETAEILGSSSISVRTHLSRARKKLRAALADTHPTGEAVS